jgi:capsular exopolysaccharide synthesis family protein
VASPAHRLIVRISDQPTLSKLDPVYDHKLVIGRHASPIAVEQFRRLAGTLHDLQAAHGLKTLMITSSLPGEGKTLVTANLALTLSEACQRRVLLIDGDLRRPFIHKVFRLSNAFGLGDVLQSQGNDLPLVRVSEYLTVLPGESIDQPMAMTSDRMRVLLEQCSTMFDWVLIDAAPVGFMPDAQLLSRLTRAVLFVIAANDTPHALVTRAIAELGPECIVGTVLNSVDDDDIPAAAYYHEYYTHNPRSGE